MRILACILAFTVLFLACKPGVEIVLSSCDSNVSCCVDSCIPFSSADNEQHESERGDCTGNSCNPFQSCGTSFIVNNTELQSTNLNVLVSNSRTFNYKDNIHSQFSTDFWHPPRIA